SRRTFPVRVQSGRESDAARKVRLVLHGFPPRDGGGSTNPSCNEKLRISNRQNVSPRFRRLHARSDLSQRLLLREHRPERTFLGAQGRSGNGPCPSAVRGPARLF